MPGIHADAMAVIFVFNVMKYLRIGGAVGHQLKANKKKKKL